MVDYEQNIRIEELQGDLSGIQEKISSSPDPFVLIKEGLPIAILQNVEGYQHVQKALLMLKMLSLGEADIRNNKVRDQDEVFESIRTKIGSQHE